MDFVFDGERETQLLLCSIEESFVAGGFNLGASLGEYVGSDPLPASSLRRGVVAYAWGGLVNHGQT